MNVVSSVTFIKIQETKKKGIHRHGISIMSLQTTDDDSTPADFQTVRDLNTEGLFTAIRLDLEHQFLMKVF